MSNKTSFVEGIVLGAVLGFVGGILLAPQSGKDTRGKIKQFKKDNEYRLQDVKDRTDKLIAQTLDAIDTGFEKVGNMVDKRNAKRYSTETDDVYGS